MSQSRTSSRSGAVELSAERLGGAVLLANDEFFAPKENLLRREEPVWKEDLYTERGKWMDGWETRRRREPGHDWCIIRLGIPGVLREVLVDTAYFRGNYPEACAIEACAVEGQPSPERLLEAEWTTVLERSDLEGHHQNWFDIDDPHRYTHLRLNIFPDGGVARLRVYGEPVPELRDLCRFGEINLAAMEYGARTLVQSDMFFGDASNLLQPGRGLNMGDGWETKRRRGPGHDWVIVRLAATGTVRRVEIDTTHFKGNYPDTATLQVYAGEEPLEESEAFRALLEQPSLEQLDRLPWTPLLARHTLQAHTVHVFDDIDGDTSTRYVLFRIFPDGGVSRLRIWGEIAQDGLEELGVRRLNALPERQAYNELLSTCGSTRWAREMVEARPYRDFDDVFDVANSTFDQIEQADWLEAFRAHPRIGEKKAAPTQSARAAKWSASEQASTAHADIDTLDRLMELNRKYADRHGFIFIVCASGKSSEEMLGLLEQRLDNDTPTEITVAAEEQKKITRLRLRKLVYGEG